MQERAASGPFPWQFYLISTRDCFKYQLEAEVQQVVPQALPPDVLSVTSGKQQAHTLVHTPEHLLNHALGVSAGN